MVTLFHHGVVTFFFVFVKSLALLTNSYRNKLHYPSKTNMAERLMALKTALTGLINDIIKLISGCSVLKDIMSDFFFLNLTVVASSLNYYFPIVFIIRIANNHVVKKQLTDALKKHNW